jgi:hypothetical protein
LAKLAKKFVELSALKGKIREEGFSYRKLASIVGIAPTTLCQKINGYSCFNGEEMILLIEELDIPVESLAIYFFPSLFKKTVVCDICKRKFHRQ